MEDSEKASDLHCQKPQTRSNFIPMLGNFHIQYNLTSASISVAVLSGQSYLGYPLRAEPRWAEMITLPTVFLGAMTGMLVMGRLGDVLGRSRAMQLTLSFSVAGCLVSTASVGDANTTYAILSVGRLILGVGVGGIYPLAAVSSAEGTQKPEDRRTRVGTAFFFQTLGCVAPYAVALVLFTVQPSTPEEWVPQLQFRLLFGLGAVPGLIILVATFQEKPTAEDLTVSTEHSSLLDALRRQPPEVMWTLLGTAGSWFLYDVALYGTNIFTPMLLVKFCLGGNEKHGVCDQTLRQIAWQCLLVQSMGVVGCLLTILLIGKLGSKRLNVVGFLLMSFLFAATGIVWSVNEHLHAVLFVLFCALTFCLNFGTNLGTYVLPATCFPQEIRSTCHGLSAFGGKLGAVVGTLIFEPVSGLSGGISALLFVQAAVCVCGALVSQSLLKHDWEYRDKDGTEAADVEESEILEPVGDRKSIGWAKLQSDQHEPTCEASVVMPICLGVLSEVTTSL